MGTENYNSDAAKRQSDVVEWLNYLFPDLKLASEASEQELRASLLDGTVLCSILSKISPGFAEVREGVYAYSERRLTNITKFISAVELMGLPSFSIMDLDQGPISTVVECLLSLRENSETIEHDTPNSNKSASQLRKKWNLPEGDRDLDVAKGNHIRGGLSPIMLGEERRSFSDLQHSSCGPVLETSSATFHHAGHNFHQDFQLKHGQFSDLSAAKIAEMMKSTRLDSAPTQSLLSVIYGILDENIDRRNEEIPQRVALLLKRVVQEIERRMSTQSEQIRNQNNLIKAREEKYQSRIKLLETLANGTIEETKIVMRQFHMIKTEKSKIEERKKVVDQDLARLMKEKETKESTISELNQELKMTIETFEHRCRELECKEKETKVKLDAKVKEVEFLVADSKKKIKELEEATESKYKSWSKKETIFQSFMHFQLHSVKDLRLNSESIRQEVINSQRNWQKQVTSFGQKLKVLVDAAENYHTVLAENQKLYNEVQDLKGNIRVYCRIRPFLPGQTENLTTIDYIGENGEILVVNPSKPGKEGHRMFKFNKVFSPAASQAEVFSDIQPLIRSVLDGYNICIFAYGQTGSGKTYTMTGPNSASVEDWGVNYRALNDLFDISQNRRNSYSYEVGVQMVEIYNEQVRDLLSDDGPQKRLGIWSTTQPNGLAVPEASMHPVRSTLDVLQLMQIGQSNRAVGSTALNERSSRSHSVLTVHVRGMDVKIGSTSRGCLHLIDLAGSERVERSEATGHRLKEAQHINKSLSALGDVIFALAQKSTHVPYRNSKLTQVLQSSLGGQAKTLMLVQINPDVQSYSETISTLKFAERVSGVELGAARSNKEGKDIKDLLEQVALLKDMIAKKDEEIEQLQFLKSPLANNEKYASKLLRHSSSSPGIPSLGISTKQDQRLSSWKQMRYTDQAAPDVDNSSESDDKYHEVNGGGTVTSLQADMEYGIENMGERLSDVSDGGLSMGKELDGSISNVVEMTAERPKVSSQVSASLNMRTGQASSMRLRMKDPLTSTSMKKATTSQATGSSTKAQRRL